MISDQDNCKLGFYYLVSVPLYIVISANDKILEITWNSPFFPENSTTKHKGHGIFADELLLVLDEVEFPFNLDYIYRWKLFMVEWVKQYLGSLYTIM